jgi:hypothetical protein
VILRRKNHLYFTLIIQLFCFSIHLQPLAKPLSKNKSTTVRVREKGAEFSNHPFMRKCFERKDLPKVILPKISIDDDPELNQKIYNFQFNGKGLFPRLILADERISLEKTNDELGYYISITKPDTENEFELKFELTNSNDEVVIYLLNINGKQATFTERLSDQQAKAICIRNQLWLGGGLGLFMYDQFMEQFQAETNFNSIGLGSLHTEGRYYLGSEWGLIASYKAAPGKLEKSETTKISSTSFQWKVFEIGSQWRRNEWLTRKSSYLIYPYIRSSIQMHDAPWILLDSRGEGQLSNARFTQFSLGLGANIFNNQKTFFEVYLNYKYLLANKELSAPGLGVHFDGGLGFGKTFHKKWTYGLFWYGHIDQFKYLTEKTSIVNSGKLNLLFSSFDFKIGYIF